MLMDRFHPDNLLGMRLSSRAEMNDKFTFHCIFCGDDLIEITSLGKMETLECVRCGSRFHPHLNSKGCLMIMNVVKCGKECGCFKQKKVEKK